MRTRFTAWIVVSLWGNYASAQFEDTFEDQDLLNSDWISSNESGTGIDFQIIDGELNTAGPSSSSTIYISSPYSIDFASHDVVWNFDVRYDFAPSSSNYVIIHLGSSSPDLITGSGFYLKLGESGSGDGIDLHRPDGSLLIEDHLDLISTDINVTIRVTRFADGNWLLEADVGSGYEEIGTDMGSTIPGQNIGFVVRHSSTRSSSFFFDNVHITSTPVPDTTPPELLSLDLIDSSHLLLTFSESLEVPMTSHFYFVPNKVIVSSGIDSLDSSRIYLMFESLNNGGIYELHISGLSDISGNSIQDTVVEIHYLQFVEPGFRHVVVNEFIADPSLETVIPNVEFVELYNTTAHYFNVEGWRIADHVGISERLPADTLKPGEYLIVCTAGDEYLFEPYGAVVGISGFPNFNSSSPDGVYVLDSMETVLDSIRYMNAPKDGISFEQINPLSPCTGIGNFQASIHPAGGTPGFQNSTFDVSPDTIAPSIAILDVLFGDSIRIGLTESYSKTGAEKVYLDGILIPWSTEIKESDLTMYPEHELESEVLHEIVIQHFVDCSGNEQPDSIQFYFDQKGPELTDIEILSSNELLLTFHEALDESSAERESNYQIGDVEINKVERVDSLANVVFMTLTNELHKNAVYELFTMDVQDSLGNYDMDSLSFEYLDDVDTAIAFSSDVIRIQFSFIPDSTSVIPRNFWIDGNGHPEKSWMDSDDPYKVWLQFESKFPSNRIERIYMRHFKDTIGNDVYTPAQSFIHDTRSPGILDVDVADSTHLYLTFSEPIEPSSAINLNHYRLDGVIPPSEALLSRVDQIQLTFNDSFKSEVTQELDVVSVSDLSGNKISTTRTIQFTYDPIAPRLDSVYLFNDSIVALKSHEQLDYSALSVSDFVFGDSIYAKDITPLGPDSLWMYLGFDIIPESPDLELRISNWEDKAGNRPNGPIIHTLNTRSPVVSEIVPLSKSRILVRFSHPMSWESVRPEIEILTNNVLNSQGRSDSLILELEKTLIDGTSYELILPDIRSLHGEPLQRSRYPFYFFDYVESIQIIDSLRLDIAWSTRIADVSTLNFSIDGFIPIAVSHDRGTSEILLERPIVPNVLFQISWHSIQDEYARKIPDGHGELIWDTAPPIVQSITSDFLGEIHLEFSESIDISIVDPRDQFEILGVGHPVNIEMESDSTVSLSFEGFLDSMQYILVYRNLADLLGNTTVVDSVPFTYLLPDLPKFGDIRITEIMFDPSPEVGLPGVEYIEIFNTTSRIFDLKGIQLTREQFSVQLPRVGIYPDSYLVVSRDSIVSAGILVELFALPNEGAELILQTVDGRIIDSVSYDLSMHESSRRDGGYSLELINPQNECINFNNWASSRHAQGGTPGQQSSVFSLNPDSVAPQINNYYLNGNVELIVELTEPLEEDSGLFTHLHGSSTEIDWELEGSRIQFHFGEPLDSGILYQFEVGGGSDCYGNQLDSYQLEIGLGASPSFRDLIFTEIMSDPTPEVGLPAIEYIELFNTSSKTFDLGRLELAIEQHTARLTNSFFDPGSYVVISRDSIVYNGLEVDLFVLPNDGSKLILRTVEGVVIDSLEYGLSMHEISKREGGYSLEIINPENECPDFKNWTSSTNLKGGTPGERNSVYNLKPDSISPLVIQSFLEANNQLVLQLSEPIIEDTSLKAMLDPPVDFTILLEEDQLRFFFDEPLDSGLLYSFWLSDGSDCYGNPMDTFRIEIGIGARPSFGDIVISEIMMDPNPVLGLPDVEYIEITNTTAKILSLDGLIIHDEAGASNPLSTVILGGEIQVLTPSSAAFDFSDAIPVGNWIGLNNEGDLLRLVDSKGRIIHYVNYSSEMFGEVQMDGRSLEMIDTGNPCGSYANWKPSTSLMGGTPGTANSVETPNPDHQGPQLASIWPTSFRTIRMQFDEALSVDEQFDFAFDDNIRWDSISYHLREPGELILHTSNMPPSKTISFEMRDLSDCLGNTLLDPNITFIKGDTVGEGLIINEILFNPLTGSEDFFEVLNSSDRYITLDDLAVRNIRGDRKDIGVEQNIAPLEYLVFTTDKDQLLFDYPGAHEAQIVEIDALPSFPNEEGSITILLGDELIDSVFYHSKFHNPLLKNADGVSLERMHVEGPSSSKDNWTSASENEGFATPGYKNSQSTESGQPLTYPIKVEPKIFIPGSSSFTYSSYTSIRYSFGHSGLFANVQIFNQNGYLVRDLVNGLLLSKEGFIRWDGDRDDGSRVRTGPYLILFEVYGNGKTQVYKETVVAGFDQ
jgi:hypothetical protein